MNINEYYYKENTQENRDKLSKLLNQEVTKFSCADNVLKIETKLYLESSICEISISLP